jgi:hypothetical protein
MAGLINLKERTIALWLAAKVWRGTVAHGWPNKFCDRTITSWLAAKVKRRDHRFLAGLRLLKKGPKHRGWLQKFGGGPLPHGRPCNF